MRIATAAALAALLPAGMPGGAPASVRPPVGRAIINDNRSPAGTLRDGVLTIRLDAREGEWHPDGESAPGLVVRAFAAEGGAPSIPGPLIRVTEGTVVHAFVTNTLPRALVVHGLSPRGLAAVADDSLLVPPGATRDVRFLAGAPGTYYYRGRASTPAEDEKETADAELSGAFVVDPGGATRAGSDRVFLIALWGRTLPPGGFVAATSLLRFTINGMAWPNTERLAYGLGDTVRFRVINTSNAAHPMHLHGFYFDVGSRGDGRIDSVYARSAPPYRVVTERAAPGRTFTMTWVPERAGNWLFHCHDNFHVLRNHPLDGTALPAEHLMHVNNHAKEMMGGLVMGIEVRGAESRAVPDATPRRRLRLVARVEAPGADSAPAYGYVLQEGPAHAPAVPYGPTILLKRGQPVSITVVNELPEATAVHWHGIELESYFDGVAGFAGSGRHIAPVIAPADSFEARFTPPRSGTFMYHPHADELRQQQAGLSGALLVLDDPAAFDPSRDIVVLLTVPRADADQGRVLINGTTAPAALDLRAGERYRLRIVDIHTYRPSMIVRVLRDSALVTWRAVAKDGMDLPPERATTRRAVQQMGNGETYDFELAPTVPGELRLTVSAAAGALLGTMPIRVR